MKALHKLITSRVRNLFVNMKRAKLQVFMTRLQEESERGELVSLSLWLFAILQLANEVQIACNDKEVIW